YIMYAAQIAAMAPATHLGAATPVALGSGSDADGQTASGDSSQRRSKTTENGADLSNAATERRKVINDAAAYIRSLAERRGRNADWAEKAVRHAVSLTAKEALEKHVINMIASSETDLLKQ